MASLRSFLTLLAITTISPVHAQGDSSSTAPVIKLPYAQYQGASNSSLNINAYYDVRYAAPPVGDLRFRAPVDIERQNNCSASSVIDASVFGPTCIQGSAGWSVSGSRPPPSPEPGSEDCLLMDILTPQKAASTSLPVIVQIHGGGYVQGGSHQNPGYALLNQSRGNIVYVAMQYRLNAFGFLSSAEVRADGDANAGLLDQRSALKWVQRNIHAFGGDPTRVTILGGSAGGGSVMNQMILHGGVADPPFSAAISEFPWWQPYHNNSLLEIQYRQVLRAAKCADIKCLRSLDSKDLDLAAEAALIAGYNASPRDYEYGDFYYGPSVDGQYIRDLPSNEFKRGHFTKVPLLVDHDGYEGFVFSNASETTMAEETVDLEQLFPNANVSFFNRLFELYPASAFNSTLFQRQTIFGDFVVSRRSTPCYLLKHGRSPPTQVTYHSCLKKSAVQTDGRL